MGSLDYHNAEIWQAHRRHCCRSTCRISERSYNSIQISRRGDFVWSCNKTSHDDVIKWRHFLLYWPFVWGIHPAPVNSPHKCQWRGAFKMFSLIYAWINGWVNNRGAGVLRRHRAHYDVTAMLSDIDTGSKPGGRGNWHNTYTQSLILCSRIGATPFSSHIHYGDVIMGAIASHITSLYSTVYSDADERKHQSSASLAFVRGTGEFPAQMASNAEDVSIWWRHHLWPSYCSFKTDI